MPTRKHYIRLSLVFITIIGLPAFQTLTRIFPQKELNGVFYREPMPRLTWDQWIHFRYQPLLNRQVEHQFGFRPFFIRLYNQLDYSLFSQPHGTGIVVGKEGFLYERWFITAHFGDDFVGQDSIDFRVRQLRQVRNYFNQHGKELMVIVGPSKADFYPEYIPDWIKSDPSATNYERMVKGIQKAGIPLLDFNRLFLKLKDPEACPLFPKTGTHWSHFGARYASDSLSGFVGALMKRPMPAFSLGPAEPGDSVVNPDDDLEKLMNLFFPLSKTPLCYPSVLSQPAEGFHLPSAIVVGDSFFWEMFNIPLKNRIFSDVKYWYYNSSVYPDSFRDSLHTSQLKFPEAFDHTDLIILMANPSNIQSIGWGFPGRVVRELCQPGWEKEYEKMILDYIRAINNTPSWKNQIERNARDQGVPTDSLIRLNAKYMVEQYLLQHDLF
jgi:hypothetical protein